MAIEAIISKSDLYKELKQKNDVNTEIIDELTVTVSDLTEELVRIRAILQQFENMFDVIFSGAPVDQFEESIFKFNQTKTDKSGLN